MTRLPAILAALAVLAGCSIGTPPQESNTDGRAVPTAQSNVDVDTPALREAKAAAGIADCAPGEAKDGGLPDVTLPCLGGGPDVPLPSLKGPMVINLFAQWCEPCRDELPYYQRLHEQLGDKVRVVGIDYLDTQPGGAIELAEQTGVTYPLLADPSGVLRQQFRVRGLPGVVFVDADGQVTNPGGRPTFTVIRSYAQLTDLVQENLGITP